MNRRRNIPEMKRFYSEAVIRRNAELPASASIEILKHGCIEVLPYCSMETGKRKNKLINNYLYKYLQK
jgi:hypothetical protein